MADFTHGFAVGAGGAAGAVAPGLGAAAGGAPIVSLASALRSPEWA